MKRWQSGNTIELLAQIAAGTPGASETADRLFALVYQELRALAGAAMRRGGRAATLQPTALVHEAFVKLVGADSGGFRDREHFLAVAVTAMRQILIDHARRRHARRRGGDRERLSLSGIDMRSDGRDVPDPVDLLALDDALTALSRKDERKAKVVELRFFAGLSAEEAASALGVSLSTVEADWRLARAWLSRHMGGSS